MIAFGCFLKIILVSDLNSFYLFHSINILLDVDILYKQHIHDLNYN